MGNQPETSNFATTRTPISQEALGQLFYEARTHSTWLPEPVPVRFVFLTSSDAKARLKSVLAPGNVDKAMAAPVTVIIAWDTEFHENLPRLFPQFDMRSYFVGNHTLINETAFRNSSFAGCLFHPGRACSGVRLRTDVRF
jgi:3-hydroxypropanoate dehydrogenase